MSALKLLLCALPLAFSVSACGSPPAQSDDIPDPAGLDAHAKAVERQFGYIKDPLDRASAEISAGEPEVAQRVLIALPESQQQRENWKPLFAQAVAVAGAISHPPDAEPMSTEEIWADETYFELVAKRLKSAPDQANASAELAERQAKMFPLMRKAYTRLSSEKMWENNVEVRSSGRALTFTAAPFADNGNVKAAYEASLAQLQKLRFTSVEYKWCQGCRGWRYDLKPPADAVIGSWSGATFEPAK